MGKRKHDVFWIRMELHNTRTKQGREAEAGRILQDVYRCSIVKDAQMVTDEGLINLIGAGIRDAFTDAAADEEGSAEA